MARLTPPSDGLGRRIEYLRLSVTDRCNLRCLYCLPAGASFGASEEAMTDSEIEALVRAFIGLGFSRVRITGGEPLVRDGIVGLVSRLAAIPGLRDLSLSTNGVRLGPMAGDIRRAGLRRLNVSLDTLKPERFQRIARFGTLEGVLAGVSAALSAGLSPVKLNMVAARGMNEDEVSDFARLSAELPVHVRFIELMPMGVSGFFDRCRIVPLAEILERAAPLEPLPRDAWPAGAGPARYWRRPGGRGTVGVISAMTCGFCDSCNRVRLTSRGKLVPCLDGEDGADLLGPLRAGAGPEELRRTILSVLAAKPSAHRFVERAAEAANNPRSMCSIGG